MAGFDDLASPPTATKALTPSSPAAPEPDKSSSPGMMERMISSIGSGADAANKKIAALDASTMQMKPPELKLPPKPEPKMTDPVEAWGSMAMVFAALASLKVRNHASTAMNAAAAAMKGIQQKDKDATDAAFKQWEVESKNAIDMANFQQRSYDELLKNVQHKEDLARSMGSEQDRATEAKIRTLTTALGDPAMVAALDHGGLPEAAKLQQTREKQAQDYKEKQLELSKNYNAMQARQTLMASPEFQAAGPIEKINMLAENQKQFGTMASNSSGRGYITFTPEQIKQNATNMANLDQPMFSDSVTAHSETALLSNQLARDMAKEKGLELSNNTYDELKKQELNATSGQDAKVIRSLTTVKNHLDLMDALTAKLPDTSDVKAFNWAIIGLANQMSDENVSDFNTAKQVVVNEVLKAVSGTGASLGQADRQELEEVFDPKKSKEALYNVSHTLKELVSGQVAGLTSQYGKFKPATEVMAVKPEVLKSMFIDPKTGEVDRELVKADKERIKAILHPEEKPATPATSGEKATKEVKPGEFWTRDQSGKIYKSDRDGNPI